MLARLSGDRYSTSRDSFTQPRLRSRTRALLLGTSTSMLYAAMYFEVAASDGLVSIARDEAKRCRILVGDFDELVRTGFSNLSRSMTSHKKG